MNCVRASSQPSILLRSEWSLRSSALGDSPSLSFQLAFKLCRPCTIKERKKMNKSEEHNQNWFFCWVAKIFDEGNSRIPTTFQNTGRKKSIVNRRRKGKWRKREKKNQKTCVVLADTKELVKEHALTIFFARLFRSFAPDCKSNSHLFSLLPCHTHPLLCFPTGRQKQVLRSLPSRLAKKAMSCLRPIFSVRGRNLTCEWKIKSDGRAVGRIIVGWTDGRTEAFSFWL